jgi:hypothetical protein
MPQISLRQLLILVAVIAFAIVSVKYASPIWQGIIGLLVMIAVISATLIAIFDRGPRQVFAIGFALVAISYWLLVLGGGKIDYGPGDRRNREFDIWNGRLPTTIMLRPLYERTVSTRWFNSHTNQEVSSDVVAKVSAALAANSTGPAPPLPFRDVQFPSSDAFSLIGHLWWTMLLGFFGGHVARFAYVRRTKEGSTHPPAA